MMTFPTIAAGTRANEAIGGYANFVAYCNALAAGVDSVTTTAAGAALKANNLSDLASASTARTNLGLGTMATATATDYLTKAGNLAGLADLPTARTNLGLGTAAVADTGTGASNVILGNDSRLTDTRTPSAASIVDAMIASTLSPSKITGTAAILGTNTFTAQQFIDGSSDQIQLRVQGVAGQSANAITVENSSASVLASISAAGVGTFAGITTDGAVEVGRSAAGRYIDVYNGDATNLQRLRLTTSGTNAVIQATRGSGTVPNLIFKIDGAERMNISSDGVIGFGTLAAPVASISAAGKGLFANVGPTSGNLNLVDSANDIGVQIRTSDVTIPKRIISSATGVSALTMSGQIVAAAATTAASAIRLPHGTAPSSPADGDMWTTTAGLFVRINGATVGPLS